MVLPKEYTAIPFQKKKLRFIEKVKNNCVQGEFLN